MCLSSTTLIKMPSCQYYKKIGRINQLKMPVNIDSDDLMTTDTH